MRPADEVICQPRGSHSRPPSQDIAGVWATAYAYADRQLSLGTSLDRVPQSGAPECAYGLEREQATAMRTFYDLLSMTSSAICGLYFVHAFLAIHARLSEIREAARAEATLGLLVKARRHHVRERRVKLDRPPASRSGHALWNSLCHENEPERARSPVERNRRLWDRLSCLGGWLETASRRALPSLYLPRACLLSHH